MNKHFLTTGVDHATESNGVERILSGIAEDADTQVAAVIAEAEKIADERIHFAKQKAENIRKEAREKAAEQAEQIKQTVLSGIKVTLKREKMAMQDKLLQNILSRVRIKLSSTISSAEYRETLIDWIVEAAIGLDADAAQVNASSAELPLIDAPLLQQATSHIALLRNKTVQLSLSGVRPLDTQGVVVTAEDKRTAFNNQVVTRMRQMDRQIRNLVYDTLFPSKNDSVSSDKRTDKK